jgi:hypothetical protein
VGRLEGPDISALVDIAAVGDRVLGLSGNSLSVVDGSDPASPRLTTTKQLLETDSDLGYGSITLAADHRFAYGLVSGDVVGMVPTMGFDVIDLDGADGPSVVGRIRSSWGLIPYTYRVCHDAVVADGRAYLSCIRYDPPTSAAPYSTKPTLTVFDFSEPANPGQIAEVADVGSGIPVVRDDRLYPVGRDRIIVVDVSEPERPRKVRSVAFPGPADPWSAVLAGRRIYVADAEGTPRVGVVDIADPDRPYWVGAVPVEMTGNPRMAAHRDCLWVTGGMSGGSVLATGFGGACGPAGH